MSDEQSNTEEQHSRREVMKGGAALGTAALISKFSTGVSKAQQTGTEPRLQLGDDWELDDYDDGSGNTNVRLRHIPSGAELRYSVSDNAWIPSGQIGLPGDRPDAYLDTADVNSLSTEEATITQSVSADTPTPIYAYTDARGNTATNDYKITTGVTDTSVVVADVVDYGGGLVLVGSDVAGGQFLDLVLYSRTMDGATVVGSHEDNAPTGRSYSTATGSTELSMSFDTAEDADVATKVYELGAVRL